MNKAKRFISDIWRLAKPYWFSEERWQGRLLLGVIVGMSLTLVFINVLINKWNNAFYDTLQNHDLHGFYMQIGKFCVLAFSFIIVAVYQAYLRLMLQIRWRKWLTDLYLSDWLSGRVYYGLQMRTGDTDNPDQRIADDINLFVGQTLTLTLGFLESTVTLVSFVGILWGLSGSLGVTLFGAEYTVPGYMVWVALFYSIIGTWLTHRVGRPLIRLNYDQQRYEADFRFSLVRFRENVEGVALYRGEKDEGEIFKGRFAVLMGNWWAIMIRRKRLAWLTTGYAQAAVVFPFIAAAPRYFSGAIQLGDLMQTASAFGHVQGALSWFVDAYTELAAWKATVDRLTTFTTAMEEGRLEMAGSSQGKIATGTGEELALAGLALDLPDGRPLAGPFDLTLSPGETLLISGPSGIGKSTLIKAVAGLWPYFSGRVSLPASGRMLFLPQKPYLPIGDLRTVASYPTPPGGFTDEAIREALTACRLPHLCDRLGDASYWAQQLSPGEQQRLAFARMLLQKLDWLFLDEATSAVDEAGERALYALLAERLPHASVISVGHRSSLAAFHQKRLTLTPGPDGAGGAAVALATA